jgi:hypothetical protein
MQRQTLASRRTYHPALLRIGASRLINCRAQRGRDAPVRFHRALYSLNAKQQSEQFVLRDWSLTIREVAILAKFCRSKYQASPPNSTAAPIAFFAGLPSQIRGGGSGEQKLAVPLTIVSIPFAYHLLHRVSCEPSARHSKLVQ